MLDLAVLVSTLCPFRRSVGMASRWPTGSARKRTSIQRFAIAARPLLSYPNVL